MNCLATLWERVIVISIIKKYNLPSISQFNRIHKVYYTMILNVFFLDLVIRQCGEQ